MYSLSESTDAVDAAWTVLSYRFDVEWAARTSPQEHDSTGRGRSRRNRTEQSTKQQDGAEKSCGPASVGKAKATNDVLMLR